MKRILILAATTGYQTRVFEEAARRLGLEVTLATDRCKTLDDPWGDDAIPVRFHKPADAIPVLASAPGRPDGVVAVGDRPTVVAAMAAAEFGLPYHSVEAVTAARNKYEARQRWRAAGLLVPEYFRVGLDYDPPEAARSAVYPCVLKPLGLSGSRGVIRADNEGEFIEAFDRIRALLETRDIRRLQDEADHFIHVETFIPGREFALEGVVTDGRLHAFAIFDKPDPLDGPYFEETIYVTPSRAPAGAQRAIVETTGRAAHALGLRHGPIHAEMRCNEGGVWMLEVAARPIGGLCSKCLQFEGGASLEEIVLRHALGEDVSEAKLRRSSSGVMMIPIPRNGIYVRVEGTHEAAEVAGIEDVVITAKEGQRLQKLPEGATYLGFIFAAADTPESVERALREAHARLRFEIAATLDVMPPA